MNWLWSTRLVMVAIGCAILVGGEASASWVLLENFNSLSPGDVNGQNGWVDGTTNPDGIPDLTVVSDPDDGSNQVLQVVRTHNNNDSAAYKPLGANSIVGTATGTLFYRIRNFINPTAPRATPGTGTVAGGDLSVGLSDVAAPVTGYGDYEAYATFAGTTSSAGQIRVRNAGASVTTTTAYNANTWTNVWLVIDNNADTYSAYSSEGLSPAVLLQGPTPLNLTSFGFRNGAASNDLTNVLIRSGFGQTVGPRNELGYIDDLYVSSGANLSNPTVVPEPATWLLLALCIGVSVAGRAQKRS